MDELEKYPWFYIFETNLSYPKNATSWRKNWFLKYQKNCDNSKVIAKEILFYDNPQRILLVEFELFSTKKKKKRLLIITSLKTQNKFIQRKQENERISLS